MWAFPGAFLSALYRLAWFMAGRKYGASSWDKFLIAFVQLIVFALVFRTYIGPLLLRIISRRIRVRSVSLRSIRGLYLRTGTITCRIDRIGISYHPPAESARRFSVKVEGLSVELYHSFLRTTQAEINILSPSAQSPARRRMPSLADFAPSPLALKLWTLYSTIYNRIEPYVRPAIRVIFVTSLRILIRCVPALTQAVDFELERCLITLANARNAHFTIQHALLSTIVNFSNLGNSAELGGTDLRARDDRRGVFSMAQLQARLAGSLSRVWSRAWGQAKGSASFELRVRNVDCFVGVPQFSELKKPRTNLTDVVASCFDHVTNNTEHQCIHVPGTSEFKGFLEFGPGTGIIEKRSVGFSLKINTVQVNADKIIALVQSLKGTDCSVTSNNDNTLRTEILSPTGPSDTSALKSPIYSRLTASMPFNPWNREIPLKGKKTNPLILLLRSIECQVGDIRLLFKLGVHSRPRHRTFTGHARGLILTAKLCEHKDCVIQRDILGSSPSDPDYDSEVMLFSATMRELLIDRRDYAAKSPLVRVIYIGPVELNGFITQWSPLSLLAPRLMQGDPNASLLVASLVVTSPQLSERMDVLSEVIDDLRRPIESTYEPSPSRQTLSFVPRLKFDICVNDVIACLIPVDGRTEPSSSLILSSTQCVMTLSSKYRFFPMEKPNFPLAKRQGCIIVEKDFTFNSVLGPAFVTCLPKPFSLDTTNRVSRYADSPTGFGDPLLSVSTSELRIEGQIMGCLYDGEQSVVLDLPSTVLDASCITDAVSIELWQPAAIASLEHLIGFAQRTGGVGSTPDRDDQPNSSVEMPIGVYVHVAISQLGIIVTGKDLNPAEDGSLTRGLALRTGLAAQYCSFPNQEISVRMKRRHAQAQARQRLYLSDELMTEVIGLSNPKSSDAGTASFFKCNIWNTALRSAIATEFAADHSYEAEEEVEELKPTEFFWISRIDIDAAVSFLKSPVSGGSKRVQMNIKIPYMHTRLQLAEAYCLMLAFNTLQHYLLAPLRQRSGRRSVEMRSSIRVTVDVCQALLRLPLRDQLSFRTNGLRVQKAYDESMKIDFASLLAWVPLPGRDDQWEEIVRLRSWKSIINLSRTEPLTMALEGESAHIRIPHTYLLADLILDLNVSFKCLKHLFSALTSEVQSIAVIPIPRPEPAKRVPVISLKIACFSLEAADDPLESRLGLAWRAGLEAARSRIERDDAFEAKVAAIQTAENNQAAEAAGGRFTPNHTVSVEEARERLLQVHALSWTAIHKEYREEQRRREDVLRRHILGGHIHTFHNDIKPLIPVSPISNSPPLLRIVFDRFSVGITQPLFPLCDLPEFLYDLGKGLPKQTEFSLLLPMHFNLSLGSTCVTLRDYPLPLLKIPSGLSDTTSAWVIDTDLVIAEEMGDSTCIVWKECSVLDAGSSCLGTKTLTLSVPKTTMPVKTYADPRINVLTAGLTEFCWGASYNAALQDVMRVIDTLSSPPPDPSPIIGFWDKMRLILHWRVKVNFASEVRLTLKGSRDPHSISGAGAGFAFCWKGDTELSIGFENHNKELLQVVSDTMLIVIPDFSQVTDDRENPIMNPASKLNAGSERFEGRYKKICAKFTAGIRWGVGFILERTCNTGCTKCHGTYRCRLFDFKAHYGVRLCPKLSVPQEKTPEDSFHEFRSDFIHLSTSLTSSVRHRKAASSAALNSFHLTPKTFAHFWGWWDLFDRFLSIPIRQGKLFANTRPQSKKFGKHLATLKYKLCVSRLFISHVYMDESRECWSSGTSKFVGIKAFVDSFEADMHQREQEAIVPGITPGVTKKIRHKPFYVAEVKLAGLQLRGVCATFAEPMRRLIDIGSDQCNFRDSYPATQDTECPPNQWVDKDDFMEVDWRTPDCEPALRMPSVASCPRFTYFRRSSGHLSDNTAGDNCSATQESSRFGDEDTHACLMGQEPSVHCTQSNIVAERLTTLNTDLAILRSSQCQDSSIAGNLTTADCESEVSNRKAELQRKISQLEKYLAQLRDTDDQESPNAKGDLTNYLMPSDISCPSDWTEFDNVYQFHCPECTLENSTRDILMQYYYCSRSRKGFEYHMATRAVKFIRDQASTLFRLSTDSDGKEKKGRNATGMAAQAAAQALRKILVGSEGVPTVLHTAEVEDAGSFNPMEGWTEGVSLKKSHFCLLLKPQVVLKSDVSRDSVCILAAVQATLQSFAILDIANADDPVSGRVMTRTHTVLSGLQSFSPSRCCRVAYNSVPLEVLNDLRAESSDFDRMVPQTNATFRYDKFNRLRLRNSINSAVANSTDEMNGHLQHQTDLIDVRVPRFTVSADSNNFRAIANVITNLLLQSDSAHKNHLNQVETLLFSYDFTDLFSAADVVEGLQLRLRRAVEQERNFEVSLGSDDQAKLEMLKIKAHIFLLTEELNLIFDAIKLAQDKADDKHNDQKSALKVHASTREISWGMVDDFRDMIVKLAMKDLDFSWLNRQDGSTVNNLVIGDLQAFDGCLDAEWPEILTKYKEPSSHSLVKRNIFVEADWTVLAPVGGITIYERFNVEFHPMRLQLEARVGKSIMEYVFPARRERQGIEPIEDKDDVFGTRKVAAARSDSGIFHPSAQDSGLAPTRGKRFSVDGTRPTLSPATRKITTSRSFTDLRLISRQNSTAPSAPMASDYLVVDDSVAADLPSNIAEQGKAITSSSIGSTQKQPKDDAAEMKTRSSQKTFILVRIASMHLLLSFRKDGSFFCRDARIDTRELQYRNRTLSFEELAEQFIPSDPTWRGWMRIALHQPLVPVLPVARELLSKTKWIATKGKVARQAKKIGQVARTSTTRLRGSSESGGHSPSTPRILADDQEGDDVTPLTMSPKSRRSGQSQRSNTDSRY